MKVVAIVPMRHESMRVPGKNFRLFAGQPLYHHVIEALLASQAVDQIVIDTDSPFIMDDAAQAFPGVQLLERPEHLRDDRTPMNDVLLNATNHLEADMFLQTHSTNPLLRPQTIDRAIKSFLAATPSYDSLFSVKALQTRLWSADCEPVNHDPSALMRTQDLEPLYEENSCLYLFSRDSLIRRGNRIGNVPLMFVMGKIESTDIDDEADFRLAETLYETFRDHVGELP